MVLNEGNQLMEMQPVIMKILTQAVEKNRVAHAYLFEGKKGTGKKEVGLYFAKMLFCESLIHGHIPCEQCIQCKRINHGNHPDIHIMEPEGLSIKIEQIRSLQQEFAKKGVESSKKFYMIVHADKMTRSAANSLLKFLEEPAANTTAILLTENIGQILPTILSRCQQLSFQPLQTKELIHNLQINGIEGDRARLLANMTNNVEDALQLNEDEWLLQGIKLVLKLYEALSSNNLMDTLLFLQNEWLAHFKDRKQVEMGLDMLLFIYRDILYTQLENDDELIFVSQKSVYESYGLKVTKNELFNNMMTIFEAKKRLEANVNSSLLMEQLIIKLQEGLSFV
ncbi:DNA polymerase III subunit delta' [Bacillus kwashiorkori]|uniref:DNA polymerase III subunit delta' n=1 Tax=Bacillus kwashiorkori TaxID=1522318 RepID=UPI0007810701|nr:DNA polymerase III subunit delta' [Bacillus kwashiorkori]